MPRHFLSIADLDPAELRALLDHALQLLAAPEPERLRGRALALVFEKPSLRTRVSFELAMGDLGGRAIHLGRDEIGLGDREPVKDVARVLGRYVDVIAARTFAHATLVELAAHAGVPVINALSDREHPCQALADLLTLRRHFGDVQGLSIAFVGDGNNVASSLLIGATMLGAHVTMATPEGYDPPAGVMEIAATHARASGSRVRVVRSPGEAALGADALYTDVWTSMGQEAERDARRRAFAGYQVDLGLLARAAPRAVIMHDMPAHRGEEITEEALESARSVALDQAENRRHAQRALLAMLVGG